MRRKARRKKPIDGMLAALTNLLAIIYLHVYFPTYSNGLKDVAGCLGMRWTEPNASGLESISGARVGNERATRRGRKSCSNTTAKIARRCGESARF